MHAADLLDKTKIILLFKNIQRTKLETLKKECCPLNLPLPSSEDATLIICTDGIQSGQDARNTITILKKILNYRGKIVLVAGVMGSDAQVSIYNWYIVIS